VATLTDNRPATASAGRQRPRGYRFGFRRRPLPGFGLSLGYSLLYMSLLVLIPLAACMVKAFSLSWADFWRVVTEPQAVAAYKLGFGAAAAAAAVNGVFGLLVAWVLTRYRFPGKQLLDTLVDFPLALPTAVAGLTYANLYGPRGFLGQYLTFLGPDGWLGGAFSEKGWFGRTFFTLDTRPYDGPLAIVVILVFVSLPFVIRCVQPVLAELDAEQEEAAASLGANRWQTFRHVILPGLVPAWLTGFALSYARCIGEYGSVIFVASNLPFETEIPPVIIVSKLEQFKYAEAAALAVVLLSISLLTLVLINLLERWSRRYEQAL
jgi:sulfate/thiosulfate transport system permease protein